VETVIFDFSKASILDSGGVSPPDKQSNDNFVITILLFHDGMKKGSMTAPFGCIC
jgi:hypothetical protein